MPPSYSPENKQNKILTLFLKPHQLIMILLQKILPCFQNIYRCYSSFLAFSNHAIMFSGNTYFGLFLHSYICRSQTHSTPRRCYMEKYILFANWNSNTRGQHHCAGSDHVFQGQHITFDIVCVMTVITCVRVGSANHNFLPTLSSALPNATLYPRCNALREAACILCMLGFIILGCM